MHLVTTTTTITITLIVVQVLGATMDGCAVNRKLIKMHQQASEDSHEVLNPFASDGRYIHFFRIHLT